MLCINWYFRPTFSSGNVNIYFHPLVLVLVLHQFFFNKNEKEGEEEEKKTFVRLPVWGVKKYLTNPSLMKPAAQHRVIRFLLLLLRIFLVIDRYLNSLCSALLCCGCTNTTASGLFISSSFRSMKFIAPLRPTVLYCWVTLGRAKNQIKMKEERNWN